MRYAYGMKNAWLALSLVLIVMLDQWRIHELEKRQAQTLTNMITMAGAMKALGEASIRNSDSIIKCSNDISEVAISVGAASDAATENARSIMRLANMR
jgi:hypothetical protein